MLTFNKSYFGLTVIIFTIEVIIALFIRDNFVRPYLGDVLVVILVYCFVQSFLKCPVVKLAMAVLVFAFSIELLQYIHIVEKLGLGRSAIVRTVIGTSFEWIDLLAYTVGIAFVFCGERFLLKRKNDRLLETVKK